MEIAHKQGYKLSYYGSIPEDWEELKFSDVLEGFSSGMTPYRGNPEYYEGDIPWITSGELKYKEVIATQEYITEQAVRNTNLKLHPPGTFFMAITGLEAAGTRGSCAISGIPATTNQSCMALIPKGNRIITQYLYQFYLNYGNELAFKFCQGTKQQSFTGGIVKRLPIVLPPTLTEQKAIATALSDVDALIDSLDQLIAKKKAIKKGVMQQLLTPPHKGGKRLPGFEGEWEELRLGDIASMNSGGTPSSKVEQYYNGSIIWVSISDMSKAGKYIADSSSKISNSGLSNSSAKLFPKGTLLLAMYASIGKCSITQTELSTSQAILGIQTSGKISTEYLFYWFLHKKDYLSAQGQQGTQSNLNKGMVEDLLIELPKPEEQKEIASILSRMDKELELLDEKRAKTISIKQGMMQELLTGKTRLI